MSELMPGGWSEARATLPAPSAVSSVGTPLTLRDRESSGRHDLAPCRPLGDQLFRPLIEGDKDQ